jgi:predicted AAA+ superfamily ATPase
LLISGKIFSSAINKFRILQSCGSMNYASTFWFWLVQVGNFNKRVVKTPKLYFYDTGLASFLLRITDSQMLLTHPARGAIFENFIITELIRNRFNAGKRSNLYFWRDRSCHEIDALIDKGMELIPIEIKSGQTITADYFKGLKFWAKLTGKSHGLIFYGGDSSQKRSDGIEVKSWRDVKNLV